MPGDVMIEKVKLRSRDLTVGEAIPWSIYDEAGRLLLQKGEIIPTVQKIDTIMMIGGYRHEEVTASEENLPNSTSKVVEVPPLLPPIKQVELFIDQCHELLLAFLKNDQNASTRTINLCKEIVEHCEEHADMLLGAIHFFEQEYNELSQAKHQIHMAVLAELLAKRLDLDVDARINIIAAALTCNVGMYEIACHLQQQPGELTDKQKLFINNHPDRSVNVLSKNGVSNALWLQSIAQHHEHIDGGGYPLGVIGDQIVIGARVLNLAETYAAMTSPRAYRETLASKEALRELFVARSKQIDEVLAATFIKEMGIYPPGAIVHLANGDLAVVVRRGADSHAPIAVALRKNDGSVYEEYLYRDCSDEEFAIQDIAKVDVSDLFDPTIVWG